MRLIMGLLAALTGLFSLLIGIRIILTWFSNTQYGKPAYILACITDPYLNWWRQRFNLKAGILDLSPIAALASLSIVQTICSTIAAQGKISLGIILAVCLSAVWSAVSFIVGFCFVVLVLRFIGYISNSNMYSAFWQIIESIARPLMYRINRIIFGRRLVNFSTGIIVSIAALAGIWIMGRVAVKFLIGLLLRSFV
ncbi:MAG: YggT family protein [Treponema sp.]|jgi:YggT family protein|nr:YggT family protein [Treponema sp.]